MEELGGFTKSEYLVSLQSIIIGFIATEYFEGIGIYFKHYRRYKAFHLFISCILLSFCLLLIHWWHTWDRSEVIIVSVTEFLKVLPYAIIFYVLSVILFKNASDREMNLEKRYFSIKNKLYGLLAFYFIYDFLVSNDELFVFRLIGLLICVVVIFSNKVMIHNIAVLVGLAIMLIYLSLDFYIIDHTDDVRVLSGYSKVEHLTIFMSFIYGYIVAKFFKGWSVIVRNFHEIKISWIHIVWSILAFLFIIDIWWGNWDYNIYIAQHFLNFIIVLTTPFLLYILVLFLFPASTEPSIDYWVYFNQKRKYLVLVVGILLISRIAISFWFGFLYEEYPTNLLRLAGVAVTFIVWKSTSSLVHSVIFIVAVMMLLMDFVLKTGL